MAVVIAVQRPAGGEGLEVEQQRFVDQVLSRGGAGAFVGVVGDGLGGGVVVRRHRRGRTEPAAILVERLSVDAPVVEQVEIPVLVAAHRGGAVAQAGEDVAGRVRDAFFADDAVVVVHPAGIAYDEADALALVGGRGELQDGLEFPRGAVPVDAESVAETSRVLDVPPEVFGVVESGGVVGRVGVVTVAPEETVRGRLAGAGRRGQNV